MITAKTTGLSNANSKLFGQPTHESHPHLLKDGEITPSITKEEYHNRREKLIESLLIYAQKNCPEKNHMVCKLY